MITLEEQAQEHTQRPVVLADLQIPFCSLRYGAGICAPNSRLLVQFESSLNWTPNADTTVLDDEVNFIQGRRAQRVDKTGTAGTLALIEDEVEDIRDLTGQTLRLAIFKGAGLAAAAGDVVVRLGDDDSNYKEWLFSVASLSLLGLNLQTFEFDSPDSTTGTPSQTPAWVGVGADALASGNTWADELTFDDLIELGVDGEPCYNTRKSCQDPEHFRTQKTTKDVRFASERCPYIAGLEGANPLHCIRPRGVDLVPSEIDQERGYGSRDFLKITCNDFLDDADLLDPYRSLRANPPESTFFRRFVERNRFLKGSHVLLREGLGISDPDSDRVTVDLEQFRTRRYVVDRFEGPNKQGLFELVCKDLLKGLDDHKIPRASVANLRASIDANRESFDLTDDSVQNLRNQRDDAGGFNFPFGEFYIRIDDEIMFVVTAPADGVALTSVLRGQLGTDADEHDEGAKVQLVQSWNETRLDDIWLNIQDQAQVDPQYIASAEAVAEIDGNLPEYILTAHISVPTKASELMQDLNDQCGTFTWWDAENQVTRIKATRPLGPNDDFVTWTDEGHIVGDSLDLKPQEVRRVTNASVFFGIINWAGDFDKPGNFFDRKLYIDADAESEDQYGDQKDKVIFGYFMPRTFGPIALSSAARYVNRFRDPPRRGSLLVTTKDAIETNPSDIVHLDTYASVGFDGSRVPLPMIALSKERLDLDGIEWEYTLEEFGFLVGKFGFWAPDSAPDFDDATPKDLRFAYWAAANCRLPDGSLPYLWV